MEGLLDALRRDATDALVGRAMQWLEDDPEGFGRAVREHVARERAAAAPDIVIPPTWRNITGNQAESPSSLTAATSLQDLVDAVTQAADGEQVRAVGSGYSFSDITLAPGHMITTAGMNRVLDLEPSVLKSPPTDLFRFEGGITIEALNQALADAGLALINMGGDDGQSFAGAMSTSTHGSGVTLGAFPSMVRSLDLVAGDGSVHRVEPADGITDPAKFAAAHPTVALHQDDAWFRTVTCAMGCAGLVHSVYLEVMPAYDLVEKRVATTWSEMKAKLQDVDAQGIPKLLTQHRHVEIDLNPYPESGGDHFAILVTRDITELPPGGGTGHRNYLTAILSAIPGIETVLVDFLNLFSCLIPALTTNAMKSLEDSDYVDVSYEVLNLGAPNDLSAYGLEVALPMDEIVTAVETIFAQAAAGREKGLWQTAPIALRFVAPAEAYLSPQVGRPTCMIECDTLNGTTDGWTLLGQYERAVIDATSARVHWGLENDVLTPADVISMYPELAAWRSVVAAIDVGGHFQGPFTARVGLD